MNPQLRFRNSQGKLYANWRQFKFSDIFTRVQEKNKIGLTNALTISAKFGLIDPLEYFSKDVSSSDKSGYTVVRKNDFAYNKSYSNGYPFGAIKRNKLYTLGLVSPLYICFKSNNSNSNDFFEQYFESGVFNSQIARIAQEGARNHGLLNVSVKEFFNDTSVYVPSESEQIKISAFLKVVDQKINLLTKKKEALETYKKGLMQKIFSQELRFKREDGTDYPEWEMKKGDELFSNFSNKHHNGDLPILAITQNYGAIPREMIDYDISVEAKSIMSYKIVEKGDFIISLRSFQGGIEYSNYRGICSPAYIILRSNQVLESRFFKAYFKTHDLIQHINSKLEGIRDGKMLSYKYFSELNLPYPSIEEQRQIGNFLSTVDEKLMVIQKLLDENTKLKKGLLQQMFV